MIREIAKKGKLEVDKININKYWNLSKTYTLKRYFESKEKAPFKSKFSNGKIILIAIRTEGTISHNRIKKLNTEVFDSIQKIFIPAYNRNVYSDIYIVMGKERQNNNQAILNPSVVIKILSNSTGNYDRDANIYKIQNNTLLLQNMF